MAHIVLASGSPRRQELLRNIGITDFDIRVPRTEESFPAGLTPQQVVAHISSSAEAAGTTSSTNQQLPRAEAFTTGG